MLWSVRFSARKVEPKARRVASVRPVLTSIRGILYGDRGRPQFRLPVACTIADDLNAAMIVPFDIEDFSRRPDFQSIGEAAYGPIEVRSPIDDGIIRPRQTLKWRSKADGERVAIVAQANGPEESSPRSA